MRTVALALLWSMTTAVFAGSYPVHGEEWARPRSGERVLAWPGVQAAVRAWQGNPQQVIVIQHAADEEAALRAAELNDWLIALGVPRPALRTRVGDTGSAALLLSVESAAPTAVK